MRLYIIRHADPDYENGTITERGHREAEALSRRLEKEGISSIYTSPVNRAVHTMEYTADRLGLGFEILDWAEEIPDWKINLPYTDANKMDAAWDVPAEILLDRTSYTDGKMDFRNTEILAGIRSKIEERISLIEKKSDEFLESLGYRKEGHFYRVLEENSDKVAVFCHGGFSLTWLSCLLSVPLHIMYSSFWLPPSSVSTVLMDKRSSRNAVPRALSIGDTSHLYKESLEISPRGIISNFV